jgi:hypothetical protein
MAARPFIVFPHIDERQLFARVQAALDVLEIRLLNSGFGILNQL